jgi:diguanylate cyclase (GGDEF)-like protein
LENISIVDDLTGLYNRKGFLALADHRVKLAYRTGEAFSIAFVDLDGLKGINDTLGHQAGNRALVDAAGILKDCFRQSDIVARLGGDEFAVFVAEAEEAKIANIVGRIQEHLAAANAAPEREYHLSFSLGVVSSRSAKDSDLETLLGRADKLMYEHKRNKRSAREKAERSEA